MGRALLVLESPQDRQKAISWINKAPVGTRVEFKASKRSLPQNDRLWAMLTDVREHMKGKGLDYSTDQFKVIFLHAWGKEIEFLPGLDGKTFVPYGQSSSDLSKEEMTSFIEFIMAWGAENGITFHDPNNEASAESPPQGPADDDGETAAAVDPSREPVGDSSPRSGEPSGSQSEPSLFGKFQFAEGEMQHLKDYARKAIYEAVASDSVARCAHNIDLMKANYLDVVESVDGRKALDAMDVAFTALMGGRRTKEQAASYIAREILGCPAADLEGRK